eukprot:scaffold29673_cov32-Cyclotella_meneghiniana.AAC.2
MFRLPVDCCFRQHSFGACPSIAASAPGRLMLRHSYGSRSIAVSALAASPLRLPATAPASG